MVRALGHSSLVVIIAVTLFPSMPALPMYAVSPQSVQYSHLGKKRTGRRDRKNPNKGLKQSIYYYNTSSANSKKLVIPNILFLDTFYYLSNSCV